MTSTYPVTKPTNLFVKLGHYLCLSVLTLLCLASPTLSETLPEKNFWVTDGVVHSIVNSGTMLYIGGDFNYVGPNTGLATTLNVSTADQPHSFPYIDRYIDGIDEAEIYVAAPDGQGGWFVGGTFTRVDNNDDHRYLIHITANNQLNNFFNFKPNAPVRALKLSHDGKTLYVGGEFTNISSNPRYRLAAISLSSGGFALSNWNPTIDDNDGVINAIDISKDDSLIYIGGKFTSLNGSTHHQGIGVLSADGGTPPSGWAATPLTINGTVNTLIITNSDESLVVGGKFSQINGILRKEGEADQHGTFDRNNLAALSAEEGILTEWNPNANDEVFTLAIDQDDKYTYSGGLFTEVNGEAQAYLARIKFADIPLDTSTWQPYLNGPVRSLVHTHAPEGTDRIREQLHIAGDFTELRSNIDSAVSANFDRFRLARFNVSDSNLIVEGWTAHADNTVNTLAIAPNGATLFAGGKFSSLGGVRQANFAALDTTNGGIDTQWRPKFNGPVNAISVNKDASYLYVAGDFSLVENKPRKQIARFSLFDHQLDTWSPQIGDGTVSAIALAKLGFPVSQIAIEPGNSDRLYAATEKGLYASNDAGASWTKNETLPGAIVRKILIDPNTPNIIFAITDVDAEKKDDEGIYRSKDGGETWTAIDSTLNTKDATDIIITSDSKRIYLLTKIEVEPGQDKAKGGLFISENGGDSWTTLVAERILTVSIDPLNNNRIYLSIEGNVNAGFFILERALSKEKGKENTYVHNYVDCNTQTRNPDPCNNGFDAGRRITKILPSLERTTDESDTVTIIYAISSGLVFKSEDSAATWSHVEVLPSAGLTTDLAIDPNSPTTLFAAIDKTGIAKTVDGGFSWVEANSGLTSPLLTSLTVDPNDSQTLYTTASLGIIQKTSNSGGQWSESHKGIPNDILFAGGDFFGAHPGFLVALDTTTETSSLFLDWNSRSDGKVSSLLLNSGDDTLYVGGSFNHIGGAGRAKLAALDVTDATAISWNPSISGNSVDALELSSNGKLLYIGGEFSQVNSIERQNIAAVSTVHDSPNEWQPSANAPVRVLKLINSDLLLLAGGDFTEIGESSRTYFASLFTSTTGAPSVANKYLTNWQPTPSTAITGRQSLAVSDQVIYIGGDFRRISDTTRQSLAAYVFSRPTITVEPAGGAFNSAFIVSFTCKHAASKTCNSADILYTTDEDLSNATWKRYNDTPFQQSDSATLSYVAIDTEGVSSAISTSKYTIDTKRPTVDIELPSGKYTYTHTSKLTCNDGDEKKEPNVSGCKSVFYTLDGSTPTFTTSITTSNNQVVRSFEKSGSTIAYDTITHSTLVPIRINSTLRVIAVDAAGNVSREIVGYYEVERGEGSGKIEFTALAILLAMLLAQSFRRSRNKIVS